MTLYRYGQIVDGILFGVREQPLDYIYGQITSVLHISTNYNLFVFKEVHMREWLLNAKRKRQIANDPGKLCFHIIREADTEHEMAYSYSGSDEDEKEKRGLKYVMRNTNYVYLNMWSYQSEEVNEDAGRPISFVKDVRQWYP